MSAMSNAEIGLVTLAAVESVQFYSAFLPSVFTIRHFGPQDPVETARNIHHGMAVATGFTLALGIAISMLMGSRAPLYASVIVAGTSAAVYEWALRTA